MEPRQVRFRHVGPPVLMTRLKLVDNNPRTMSFANPISGSLFPVRLCNGTKPTTLLVQHRAIYNPSPGNVPVQCPTTPCLVVSSEPSQNQSMYFTGMTRPFVSHVLPPTNVSFNTSDTTDHHSSAEWLPVAAPLPVVPIRHYNTVAAPLPPVVPIRHYNTVDVNGAQLVRIISQGNH